jgi:hypothetical protein
MSNEDPDLRRYSQEQILKNEKKIVYSVEESKAKLEAG